MPEQRSEEPGFDREVRVGLVLYGGVSLAVYIGGVAQEFFSAVRGRGVYALAKALTRSDFVVDIVSGTSAGGINGVLLAYALANDVELGAVGELWREHGDFARLMRPVSDDAPPSLLDGGRYFQTQLEQAFASMLSSSPQSLTGLEVNSQLESIDLFVTATDFHGQLREVFDDLDNTIQVKDHRRVFALKFRKDRHDDLRARDWPPGPARDALLQALATVSRSTATFPGAFEPVVVAADTRTARERVPVSSSRKAVNRAERSAAQLLHDWSGSSSPEPFALVDGGVLDNKPFTSTLEAIYRRTADRRVDRKLFYVEPDPEQFATRRDFAVPDVLSVVSGSLSALPAYESIASDLASLSEHNSRVGRYQRMLDQVREAVMPSQAPLDLDALSKAAPPDGWRFSEDHDASCAKRCSSHTESPEQSFRDTVYLKARVQSFVQEFLENAVAAREARRPDAATDEKQRAGSSPSRALEALATQLEGKLVGMPDCWQRGFLRHFDTSFSVRRLFHVTYHLYDLLFAGTGAAPPPCADALQKLLAGLNRHLQIYKVVQRVETTWRERLAASAAIDSALRGEGNVAPVVLAQLDQLFTLSLDQKAWLDSLQYDEALPRDYLPDTAETHDRTVGRFSELMWARLDQVGTAAGGHGSLLGALREREVSLLRHFHRALVNGHFAAEAYYRFDDIDRLVYPFENLAHLEQKDQIETVRISPKDAQLGYCARPANEKITGETVGHFGAFLKRSWRSNDLLWGRLDGSTQLLQELLKPETVAARVTVHDERWRLDVRRRLSGSSSTFDARVALQTLFPRAKNLTPVVNGQSVDLVRWLDQLLGAEPTARQQAHDALHDGAVLEALARARQAEAIDEGLDQVLADAVKQGHEWSSDARPESTDPQLANDDAEQIVTRARSRKNALQRFEQLKVGSESASRHIPVLVLMRLVAQAGLVALNVLRPQLDRRLPDAVSAALKPLLTVLSSILRFVYVFTGSARTRPLLNAARVASWVLLMVGVFAPSLWLRRTGVEVEVRLIPTTLLLVAPLLLLLVDGVRLVGTGGYWFKPVFAVAGVIALLLCAATNQYEAVQKQVEVFRTWLAPSGEGAFHPAAVVVPLGLLLAAALIPRRRREYRPTEGVESPLDEVERQLAAATERAEQVQRWRDRLEARRDALQRQPVD